MVVRHFDEALSNFIKDGQFAITRDAAVASDDGRKNLLLSRFWQTVPCARSDTPLIRAVYHPRFDH